MVQQDVCLPVLAGPRKLKRSACPVVPHAFQCHGCTMFV